MQPGIKSRLALALYLCRTDPGERRATGAGLGPALPPKNPIGKSILWAGVSMRDNRRTNDPHADKPRQPLDKSPPNPRSLADQFPTHSWERRMANGHDAHHDIRITV